MWGSLLELVINFRFRQNRLGDFRVVLERISLFPIRLLWPVAYTQGEYSPNNVKFPDYFLTSP